MATEYLELHEFLTTEVVDVDKINENSAKIDESANLQNKSNESVRKSIGYQDTDVSDGKAKYGVWGVLTRGTYNFTNDSDFQITFYGTRADGTNVFINRIPSGETMTIVIREEFPSTGYSPADASVGDVSLTAIKQYESVITNIFSKRVMFFGDSITERDYYVDKLLENTGLLEYGNYAVSGSTLLNKSGTVMNGVIDDTDESKTVPNQVLKMLNENPTQPDYIIVFAGTNDQVSFDFDETQYTDGSRTYKDLATVDLTTCSGAMRYIVESLRTKWQKVKIYFVTPLQSVVGDNRVFDIQKSKADAIIQNSNRMAIPVIDLFRNSAIYERFEVDGGSGQYLEDGLHPNSSGSTVIADYIEKKLISG